MTLYVDSSALLKRVFVEAESTQVRTILRERSAAGEVISSSELAWVEVSRALRRAEVTDVDSELGAACTGIASRRLDTVIMTRARSIGPAHLRSLDAIHLATAVTLGAEDLLTFDDRLAAAARAIGIRPIP